MLEDNNEYIQYTEAMERTVSRIDQCLHHSDDPVAIIMDVLKAVTEFYDGDWAGVLDADFTMKIWSMLWWYNRRTDTMSPNSFSEIEEGSHLTRWIDALIKGTPIVIEDVSELQTTFPAELKRLTKIPPSISATRRSGAAASGIGSIRENIPSSSCRSRMSNAIPGKRPTI